MFRSLLARFAAPRCLLSILRCWVCVYVCVCVYTSSVCFSFCVVLHGFLRRSFSPACGFRPRCVYVAFLSMSCRFGYPPCDRLHSVVCFGFVLLRTWRELHTVIMVAFWARVFSCFVLAGGLLAVICGAVNCDPPVMAWREHVTSSRILFTLLAGLAYLIAPRRARWDTTVL